MKERGRGREGERERGEGGRGELTSSRLGSFSRELSDHVYHSPS